MKIRSFDRDDLYKLLAIQRKNPEASRWVEDDYEVLADNPFGLILVAELETMEPPKLLGFAAFRRVVDEAELLNIAVDPEHQHQGVGRALLAEARKLLLEAGTRRVFLEVRPSNQAALALYFSTGFSICSRRVSYYHDPIEDALVLSLELFLPETLAAGRP